MSSSEGIERRAIIILPAMVKRFPGTNGSFARKSGNVVDFLDSRDSFPVVTEALESRSDNSRPGFLLFIGERDAG